MFIGITPVGSCTPEDKFGPVGYDDPVTSANERFISADQNLHYRVDFWNNETATAPACDVYVYDDLETNLNRSTFRFTEFGFMNWTVPLEPTQYFDVNVDTRPEMDLIVSVEGIYDPDTGRMNITYRSLDPATMEKPEDPLAGFLPPITSSGHEIGWVTFTVDPNYGLSTGTTVGNQAHVNFDAVGPFNPAPKEGPYMNTIDSGKPTSSLSALVVNGTEILVSMSGSDDTGGSGVMDYVIFMSDNGGEYLPVLNNVNATAASINGLSGHEYQLYSIARDYVGNTENPKSSPDATVIIPIIEQAPVADFMANVTSGRMPLHVQFTDLSTGSPATWNWTFGDGNTSTLQNPVYIYESTGKYAVSLNVTNSAGFDNVTRTDYIIATSLGITDKIGVFRPSTQKFYLRSSNWPAKPMTVISWGASTDLPVTGAWNSDEITDIGVYRPSTHKFYLRPSNWPATPTTTIAWGTSTDLPVTGDWDGDGTTEVGVFRPSTYKFYLRPSDWPATPTTTIAWGTSTDLPVTGDWDGDGTTDVGVYRPSTHKFYLRPSDWPATPTTTIAWGTSTDLPVTGDWDGNGTTEVGVYRASTHRFYLRPSDWPAIPTTTTAWGQSSDIPVTGKW